jgi:uncharacterized membrane protein YeiH
MTAAIAITDPSLILPVVDTLGIFVFGVTGGTVAVRHRLDMFGVVVLAMATALSGGVARDVLLGALPPAALTQPHYLWAALASGFAAFFFHKQIERLGKPVLVLDAMGLGLFAVAGCRKALDFGVDPLAAALLGMLTGVGGGILRDVLINETPRIFSEELYASAALLASVIVVVGHLYGAPGAPVSALAIIAAFLLRIVSWRRGWRAPRAPGS